MNDNQTINQQTTMYKLLAGSINVNVTNCCYSISAIHDGGRLYRHFISTSSHDIISNGNTNIPSHGNTNIKIKKISKYE